MKTIFRLLAGFIVLCATASIADADPVYEPVAAFQAGARNPGNGSLLRHTDGNFYGVAAGGAADLGTIYKVTPAGEVTVLVHFTGATGPAKGKYPQGALVSDANGDLWGTSDPLGTSGPDYGTIFKVNPTTGAFTTIAEFTGSSGLVRGARPTGALVSDGNGFFWGVTAGDQGLGSVGYGTIFKVNAVTGAFTTVVTFTGTTGTARGSGPAGGLVRDANGFFWGTATGGPGTVFKVNASTGALTTLVDFGTASAPGRFPRAGLVDDGNGFFWGTTSEGGTGNFGSGSGTIFKVRATTGAVTTVVQFTDSVGPFEGLFPSGVLVRDGAGFLWGTTAGGGNQSTSDNYGTVFKINTTTGALTTLVEFGYGTNGSGKGLNPFAGVVSDGNGSFWGTASNGGPGAGSFGTIFKVNAATGALSLVAAFTGTSGTATGKNPYGGLISDGNGSLLGMTRNGGLAAVGTIFKVGESSGALTTLVEFTDSVPPVLGRYPYSTLISDGNGSFLGTTFESSTIFRMNANTGALTTLATAFARPYAGLVSDGSGFFWGTTSEGGVSNAGTVFKINPGTGTPTTVVQFTGSGGIAKGRRPYAALVNDGKGFLWGTTSAGGATNLGTVFKLDTATGALTTVVEFTGSSGAAKGFNPQGALLSDGTGFFLGTTWGTTSTGVASLGTVFKLDTATGVLTTLVEFTGTAGAAKGSHPRASLASDGRAAFWGTTETGGAPNFGTIFKITTGGVFTSVFDFTGSSGAVPGQSPGYGSLLLHSDGNLYGTTVSGGVAPNGTPAGNGQIFRLRLDPIGPGQPEIVVEQPPGTDLADGGSASLGEVVVGDGASSTFTIKNTGTTSLTGLSITKDGADAAMFTIVGVPTPPLLSGGTTFLTVRFAPTAAGPRTASLHFSSNDSDENPFDIILTGTGTLSANADLASLSLSTGTLSPAFASGTTAYSASVPYSAKIISVTPRIAQSTATIRVNGNGTISGSPSVPIELNIGANTLTIVVTAGDGVTTKTYTVAVTRAAPRPGDVDADFDPRTSSNVLGVAVQPDGKILMGGVFAYVGALPRNNLARLLPDGTVESTATFDPGDRGAYSGYGIAVQTNGKILLGGSFNNPLTRLNADGSAESVATFNLGSGLNQGTLAVLQGDGKILLGGAFTTVNGQPRNYVARLQGNGAVEGTATFNPGTGANDYIYCVAVQPDGKVLLGGIFTSVNGQPRNRIARLNANGTLESTVTFNPGTGADRDIESIAVQADGKILLGGYFTTVNGQPRNCIARLNADGTLESTATFNPGIGANDRVLTIALQADGKILLGGFFTTFNGQSRNRIARLNPDGTLESTATFNPGSGPNFIVNSVTLQADGRVLLGGNFSSINGQSRSGMARLINDPATQSLTLPDSTRVQWARGGAAPEVEQMTFELSTDAGASWSPLGTGTRIAGGWERTGLSLPSSGSIRARGRTFSGRNNASSGLIEQIVSFAPYTPYQQWKFTHLGDANAPDLDDPDGDGLRTLAEYGLNLPPETPGGAPFIPERHAYVEGERLRVFLQREPAHNDVTIEVQAADSLAGPWSMLAISALGSPFSGPGYVSGDDSTPLPKTVEVRDTINIADAPSRFLRVLVTHP